MEVGLKLTGAHFSIASFSIILSPTQKCRVGGIISLGDGLCFSLPMLFYCLHSFYSLVVESLPLSL